MVDRYDLATGIGLALVNGGLWQIYPPLAPLVTGVLILAAVAYGIVERNRKVTHGSVDESDGTGAASGH